MSDLSDTNLILEIHRASDIDALGQLVTQQVPSEFNVDGAMLVVLDSKWDDLFALLPDFERTRFSRGKGIIGGAIKRGEVFVSENPSSEMGYDADIDFYPEIDDAGMYVAPIASETSSAVGALCLFGDIFDENLPSRAIELASHLDVALSNIAQRNEAEEFLLGLTGAMAEAADRKMLSTLEHTHRVKTYCQKMAVAAGLDATESRTLTLAALLHDVGRLECEIDEQYTPEVYSSPQASSHVLYSEAILRNVPLPSDLQNLHDIVAAHHEHFDGTGYPNAHSGKKIPRLARMLSVADSFDAYLHGRRVRIGTAVGEFVTEDEAKEYLKTGAGSLFDPEFVKLFLDNRCHNIELRRFARMDYHTPIRVQPLSSGTEAEPPESFEAVATDVSEGGILFATDVQLPSHAPIQIEMPLEDEVFLAIARVARTFESDGTLLTGAYFLWSSRETN